MPANQYLTEPDLEFSIFHPYLQKSDSKNDCKFSNLSVTYEKSPMLFSSCFGKNTYCSDPKFNLISSILLNFSE
jgi:hypothetical protein